MLPNFLVIGAMKGGTTSLHKYLKAHPEVFMPRLKELDFFAAELNWTKGLVWYEAQFEEATSYIATGEASTSYTKHPRYGGVPERMASVVPDAKLIYVVREPMARLRSHYLHEVANGRESRSIADAIRDDPHYVETSLYGMQLARYRDHYPSNMTFVVRSEDLKDRRAETLRSVLRFLLVDDSWTPDFLDEEYNVSAPKSAPGQVESRIRSLPGYRRVADVVPKPLKRKVRAALGTPIETKPADIPAALESELRDRFDEDLHLLRSLVGTFEGWDD
ncbi:MAG TPA: sulfotransferase [Actinomycetota bacterium]|nr:sulfotransferase [Actinomycetota bacterium]